jgi:hypothetical protein
LGCGGCCEARAQTAYPGGVGGHNAAITSARPVVRRVLRLQQHGDATIPCGRSRSTRVENASQKETESPGPSEIPLPTPAEALRKLRAALVGVLAVGYRGQHSSTSYSRVTASENSGIVALLWANMARRLPHHRRD